MKIEDRIKQLLLIAEDSQASSNEREQARRRADSWMIKYNIKLSKDENTSYGLIPYFIPDPYGKYRAEALYMMLEAYGSYAVAMSLSLDQPGVYLNISAPRQASDLIVKRLSQFNSQITDELMSWSRVNWVELSTCSSQVHEIKHESFYHGVGVRVRSRILAVRKDEEAWASSRGELITLSSEKSEEYLNEVLGNPKPQEDRNYDPDWEALEAGMMAGSRVRLNDWVGDGQEV